MYPRDRTLGVVSDFPNTSCGQLPKFTPSGSVKIGGGNHLKVVYIPSNRGCWGGGGTK